MEKISVIIPTIKGREELLHRLLVSVPQGHEIIVVPDEDLSLAQKRNIGALQATTEYLLFIDDDNQLQSFAIEQALKCGSDIIGLMALYDNDPLFIADGGSKRFYVSGFMNGINTNEPWMDIDREPYEVDEVANAFMMHRSLFFELGGLDEKNFPTELDEADFCIRAKRKGYRVMMCPRAVVFHRSITYSAIPDFRRPKNAYFMGRNRVLFQKKHLNKFKFFVYLVAFFPIFIVAYCLALLYKRKPKMIHHFLKGVLHGITNRISNTY